eukprot:3085362-Pyramimonas_sp.AAC.1
MPMSSAHAPSSPPLRGPTTGSVAIGRAARERDGKAMAAASSSTKVAVTNARIAPDRGQPRATPMRTTHKNCFVEPNR